MTINSTCIITRIDTKNYNQEQNMKSIEKKE